MSLERISTKNMKKQIEQLKETMEQRKNNKNSKEEKCSEEYVSSINFTKKPLSQKKAIGKIY